MHEMMNLVSPVWAMAVGAGAVALGALSLGLGIWQAYRLQKLGRSPALMRDSATVPPGTA